MARPRPELFDKKKIVAENRRARFEYFLEDVFEAGIALQGTEVKSLRFGEGNIAESYAEVKGNQVWLVNSNIPEFSHGNRYNHEPKRPAKGKKTHDKRDTIKERDWKRDQQRIMKAHR